MSVVVPVLNAEAFLPALLTAVLEQKHPVLEVIIVDSSSTDRTRAVASSFQKVRVVGIDKFTHGKARNLGVQNAAGDVVVLMTQDALPRDSDWLGRLVAPLAEEGVAATYSRQLPRDDASPMERYFLLTHFPSGDRVMRQKEEGIEPTFTSVFFSNVSAAVRRDVLLKYPFDETLIMSEDQQLSRDLIKAGYTVVYAPESEVIHSHNYSLKTVFQRYFDSVYSLTVIFPRHGMGTSAAMGLPYLWREFIYVCRTSPLTLPYYLLYTAMKTGGTLAGHFAETMPRRLARRLSLHKYHWREPV